MGRLVPVFDLPLVQGGLFFPVLFPGSLLLNFELVYCFSCCWNYHGFQPTLNYSPLTSLLLYWQCLLAWTSPLSIPNKFGLLTKSYKTLCTYGLGLPRGKIFTHHCKKAGGRDSGPLVLVWNSWSMHGPLGGDGSPWSSWLVPLKVELVFCDPAGVEVYGDPVFSAFYAWGSGSTVQVGAR